MPNNGDAATAAKYFEMMQSKRGQPSLRLYTLDGRHHRTRYVYAESLPHAYEIADRLVEEVAECGFEKLTTKGWDVESIFHHPIDKDRPRVESLKDLKEEEQEQDQE